jgi:protein-S-isoprenylcysteine O-methyltransferase Ste14
MGRRVRAWGYVGLQTTLLVALVAMPAREDWPVAPVLRTVTNGLLISAVAGGAAAAAGLGRGLTPLPLPNAAARLRTTGFYGWVRHPIYSFMLVFAIARAVGSGSVAQLGIAGVLGAVLFSKARWEEALLTERFPCYLPYAARTGRFVPRRPPTPTPTST